MGQSGQLIWELRYWRELTGTDSPAPLVQAMARRGGRAGEQGEVVARLWYTPWSQVVSA